MLLPNNSLPTQMLRNWNLNLSASNHSKASSDHYLRSGLEHNAVDLHTFCFGSLQTIHLPLIKTAAIKVLCLSYRFLNYIVVCF